MKKYFALVLVSSLVMENASASQILNALGAATSVSENKDEQEINALGAAASVSENKDEQKIKNFEVGLQFFMTPSAESLGVAYSAAKQYSNTGTVTTAPTITDTTIPPDSKKTPYEDSRMYGFGMNLGWNGLQSKIGANAVLLGSIGGVVSYSWFRSNIAEISDNSIKFERFILGVRASVAPLFSTIKDIKVGPYVAGVLGGVQTQLTLSEFDKTIPVLGDFKKGTTGTFSNNVWSNVDVNTVGIAGTVTPPLSEVKFSKIFSTDFDAWKPYYAGEVGVRFQMRNVGLQLGASFDNNEYKITSFQDKNKTLIMGLTDGGVETFNDFYAVGSTTSESVTGTRIIVAREFNDLTFKRGNGSSMNAFLTASIILDM